MTNRTRALSTAALLGLTSLGTLGVSGCTDTNLTEVPAAFVSPENFYKNENDAQAALTAAYATFMDLQSPMGNADYVGRNLWMLVEYPTEVATSRLSAANERSMIGDFHTQFSSSHAYLQTVWEAAYNGINRANSVIARVPAIPMDATKRDQIVAQAKFLRALHYYWLAGLFGGVPLKLTETQTIGDENLARASAAETWAQIEKDLTEAAAVLPASWPAAEFGRATKGAALTLLGKAYLQSASTGGSATDYTNAVNAFKQVLNLGYTLDPNYASLFDGTNEQSKEIIFSLQAVRLAGAGNYLDQWFAPITATPVYAAGAQNQVQAERPFYDSYNANDKRKDGTWYTTLNNNGKLVPWSWTTTTVTSTANYGSTGPVPRKFLDFAAPVNGGGGIDFTVLRYADVLLSLAEAIDGATGPTSEAYGYVNQVRTRAGVPNMTAGLSQQVFRDSLYVERRFELALELNGVFDMRRDWNFAKSRIEAGMAQISTLNKSPFTSSVEKFNAAPIPDKWRLYPIPQNACQLNSKLTQNPGWEDGVCK